MGLEPVKGGDVILVSPMLVPLSSVANPPESAPAPEEKPAELSPEPPLAEMPPVPPEPKPKKAIKTWTPDAKAAAWKAFDREATAYEPIFRRAAIKYFRDTSADVIDRLEKYGVKIKSNIGAMNLNGRQKWLSEHKSRFDEFLPSAQEMQTRLEKYMKPVYLAVLQERGDQKKKELSHFIGKGKHTKGQMAAVTPGRKAAAESNVDADIYLEFDYNDPNVRQWLGEKLKRLGKEVRATTVDNIKEILRDDFENGEPLMKMGEHLREYFTGAETYRANAIARTESTASMCEADLESVRQMELEDSVGKIWVNEPDARQSHQEAGYDYSEPVPIDEVLEVGDDKMLAPAGGELAEENVNCRCMLVYDKMSTGEAE